jgi:hypothetical protein
MDDSGVGGMVRTGAWLDYTAGMEVLSIGRSAIDKEDCVMELSGRSLFFRIALRGGWIWISATGMDEADQPELLFNIGDGPEGWIVVRRFCQALERSGITSLHPHRPPR